MGTATPLRVSAAIAAVIALAVTIGMALAGANVARSAGEGISSIDVLSNRADLISGGDALVAVKLAAGTDPATVRVNLNGNDITSAFAAREDGSFSGLVTGLVVGKNVLTARSPGGAGRMIVDHEPSDRRPGLLRPAGHALPLQPERIQPRCSGRRSTTQCNAPTKVDFLYRNASNQFVAYDPANPPGRVGDPDDDDGRRQDGAVHRPAGHRARRIAASTRSRFSSIRRSRSSRGRSRSRGATSSSTRTAAPAGTTTRSGRPRACSRRRSSASASRSPTRASTSTPRTAATSSSAEATMMTKEIVVERYGRLTYTVGTGGSAGSMQQHLISTNYPGLLDGLITCQVFPDHMDQVMGSLDCRLLDALLLADEPRSTAPRSATAEPAVRHERRRGSRSGAATPRTRTTCAGRRS